VGLGATCADFLFMFSIFLGLAPILHYKTVQFGMLCIGFLMLTYLGVTTVKAALSSVSPLQITEKQPDHKPFWTGFILAMMNPFNFVFWFGVYGGALQNIPPQYSGFITAGLSLFILLGIVLWNINIAFTVHFFRTLINETFIRWITGIAGVGLLGFACHLIIKMFTIYSII
jgi:threonine/homoserine/homoserine lactone efflux protein